jgi:DNA-binding PadR family transcriptional regulator
VRRKEERHTLENSELFLALQPTFDLDAARSGRVPRLGSGVQNVLCLEHVAHWVRGSVTLRGSWRVEGVAMGVGRDVAMEEGSAPERRAQAPMTSAVNWALLGLIIERPSYAYELAQRFERVYGDTLVLSSSSHAYTALGALASRSLIEEIAGTHGGRQPKPHYRATPLGIDSYRDWLVAQVREDRRRQRLSAIQLAGLAHEPEAALEVISRCEHAYLEEAGRIPIPMRNGNRNPNSAADHGSELAGQLMSEENRLAVAAKLEWLQYVREEFEALASGRASDEPARARRQAQLRGAARARRAA